jgi:adenine/guanine phosphoribosyltransferase-like PRPP-binding protein
MSTPTKASLAPIRHCPSHTEPVFDTSSFPLIVRWAEEILLKERIDGIVACGFSGLLLAGALSYATRIPVFAVRKQGEQPVAGSKPVSGIAMKGPVKRWAWVDDFLSSGGTFNRSRRLVHEAKLIKSVIPAAILSYNRHDADYNKFYDVSEDDSQSVYCLTDAVRKPYKRIRQHCFLKYD